LTKMIFNIPDLLLNSAERYPDKNAVYHHDNALTYSQISEQSLQLANALKNEGVNKGDRVCFYLEKRFEKIVSIFGISMCGAVLVPLRRLSREAQVTHIINNSGASIIITTAFRAKSLFDNVSQIPGLKTIISTDKIEDTQIPGDIKVILWADIMKNYTADYPDVIISEHDIAAILYTSGSTGNPKGVVLNHLNIVAGAKKVAEYLKINRDDRILSLLTFGFDYGLNQLTTVFLHGAQIVLLDYIFPKDVLRTIGKYKITGLAGIPTIWLQLLQLSWEGSGIESLRYITNSGGAIPQQYVMELRKRLPDTKVYLMYGLTEAFRSTYLDPSLVDQYPTSMGKALPGEEIMVLDENNRPVKAGETGQLVHRGTLVSQGYWNDQEATSIRFRKNPLRSKEIPIPEMVVYSGDYVRIDQQGLLYFSGRKDEMIKCSGNRISPEEVEEILYGNKNIAEAVVFGMPHEVFGQTIYAVVSQKQGVDPDMKALISYCKKNMPQYMVPTEIEIWDSIPRNTNGKFDRAAIKKTVYTKKGFI
jgi:acyl-CoA ligase (AMP-forming) (exosortase A-associated)